MWTTEVGGLVNRQAVSQAVKAVKAEKAGLDARKVSTHTGRRTVVTNAYAEGGASPEDVAQSCRSRRHEDDRVLRQGRRSSITGWSAARVRDDLECSRWAEHGGEMSLGASAVLACMSVSTHGCDRDPGGKSRRCRCS